MKKILFSGLLILTFLTPQVKAQIIGPETYMAGHHVNIGIAGAGGFEGADTVTYPATGIIPGLHPRSNTNYLGFVANPAMDGWSVFDGDFFTPGTPENGWGFEIIDGATDLKKSNNRNSVYDILLSSGTGPSGSTWQNLNGCIIVDWDGDYVGSGYDIHTHVKYELKEDDLFYTTTVKIVNNGTTTIPEFYYYRNVDPDNNVVIGSASGYSTQNTIVSQPTATCGKTLVSATQTSPHASYMGFGAIGANYRVTHGGFSNRDASDIWNGVGGLIGTVGSTASEDAAISLAYKATNVAPGDTVKIVFVVILDASQVEEALGSLMEFHYVGSVGSPPACLAAADTAISCSGNPITIQFTGDIQDDFNWTWSPATGLDTTAGTLVHAFPSDTTLYTVTGTPTTTCYTSSIVSQIVIVPQPGPDISITDPGVQCNQFDLNDLVYTDLNSTPGITPVFITNEPVNSTDTNLYMGNIIYPGDSVYLFMGIPGGCFDYQLVDITWSNGFNYGANIVNPTCGASNGSIEIIDLTGNVGPVTYTWSTGGPTTPLHSSIPSGSYTITMQDSAGCVEDTTINFPNVTPMTNTLVLNEGSECSQPTGNITATATLGTPGYTYDIGAGPQTSGIFTGLPAGLIVVEIHDSGGCLIFDSIIVPDTNTLDLTYTSITKSHCGTNNGSITLQATGGATPYTYQVGATSHTAPLFSPLAPGSYFAFVTTPGGCKDSIPFTIVDTADLSMSMISKEDAQCGAAIGEVVVQGTSGTPPYSYYVAGGPPQASGTFSGLAPGVYTIHATSGTCDVSITLTILDLPSTMVANIDQIIAENCGAHNGEIFASATNGRVPYTYSISGGGTNSSGHFTGLDNTSYVITVMDSIGCMDTASGMVGLIPINVDLGPDLTYCNSYTFSSSAVGAYMWMDSTGTLLSTNSTYTTSVNGTYILTVSMPEPGCIDSDTVKIDFVQDPIITPANIFTPNNDGMNDVFKIENQFVTTYHIQIFNRWGQVVYSSDNVNESWDGKFKGSEADAGVYMYIIEYDNPCESPSQQTRHGSIQLVR